MTGTSDFMSGFMTGQNSDRNYGCGMDGGWIWIILIFALFGWGGNGWGNRNNEQIDIDTRFIERDIFNTNQNVSNTACQTQRDVLSTGASTQRDILENRYTNQLGVQSIISSQKDCCCETRESIMQSNFNNQSGFNAIQNQLASCCCDIERGQDGLNYNLTKSTCEIITNQDKNTDRIINYLTQHEMDSLRTELQSAQLQLSQLSHARSIIDQLQPCPKPAYPVMSPYQAIPFSAFCGCNSNSCC